MNIRNSSSSNPFLQDKYLVNANSEAGNLSGAASQPFSIVGSINKTLIFLLILVVSASITWNQVVGSVSIGAPSTGIMPQFSFSPVVLAAMLIGIFGSLIMSFFVYANPKLAKIAGFLYSVGMGLAVGSFSAVANVAFPGIVFDAVIITLAVIFSCLFLYKFQIIRVTERFRSIVFAMGFGLLVFFLVSWILSMFNVYVPMIYGYGPMALIFYIFVAILSAFFLIIDFDNVAKMQQAGVNKELEWLGAFGLITTIVWIYINVLRILIIIASNRN